MSDSVRSGLARLASFVPITIATLLASYLVISRYGVQTFTAFQLVVAATALILASSDLGVGAAVISSYSSRGPDHPQSRGVTLTALRTLVVAMLIIETANLLITATGRWPSLLGGAAGPNLHTGVAVGVAVLSLPFGLGQSMLLGVHRNHLTVLIQTLYAPLILLGIGIVILLDVGGSWVIITPSAALLAVHLLTCASTERVTVVRWAQLMRDLPFRRRAPGKRIHDVSIPKLAISITASATLQGDRIVLSHVASQQAVANYAAAGQMFAPVLALLNATAAPLWPLYERARAEGGTGPALAKVTTLFVGGTMLLCVPLVLIADWLGHVIGGDEINIGFGLALAWAASMVAQSAAVPAAMSRMDRQGIRFISICGVVSLPVNLVLSVLLARELGASGPLLATVIVVLTMHLVPILLYRHFRPPTIVAPTMPRSGTSTD